MVKAVISDLDGTLLDTLYLIRRGQFETMRRSLRQLGMMESELPDYETYEALLHQSVGGGVQETMERTARLLLKDEAILERMDFEDMHRLLDEVQDELASQWVRAYEGLEDFLFWLGENKMSLAVFTSGTRHHVLRNFMVALPRLALVNEGKGMREIERMLALEKRMVMMYGLEDFVVVASEDVVVHKPDPAGLQMAMRRLGLGAKEVVVLGDHTVDMEAGQRAGVDRRVAVSHGFGEEAMLLQAGAVEVVHGLSEMIGWLHEQE